MRQIMRVGVGGLWVVIACGIVQTNVARADDSFYEITVGELKILEGEFPQPAENISWRHRRLAEMMIPYVVLDGAGEGFLGSRIGRDDRFRPPGRRQQPQAVANDGQNESHGEPNRNAVAIRAPKGKHVSGVIFVPNADTGMVRIRFEVPASKATTEARKNYYLTVEEHFQALAEQGLPGGAWFRHRAREAREIVTGKKFDEPLAGAEPNRRAELSRLEDTYQILSGGRAVSENLQLDRLLAATKPEDPSVDVGTLEGITVAEMDWSKLTDGIDPQLDPLASHIPADQHAVFLPSFQALITLIDEAKSSGTPVLHLAQSRAEDAGSQQRYERQLCLSLDGTSRLLGGTAIRSVAFTGSDPYLRTGTDVAVLFECGSPAAVRSMVVAKQAAAKAAVPACQAVSGTTGGIAYAGVVSPGREICSYVATIGDAVIVTNSLVQLERIADISLKNAPALASLPEYRFFRHRYDRTDDEETGLLIVTDATIRRWCGPKWRIATSRRTRAVAIMSEYQAAHLESLVDGSAENRELATRLYVPDLGSLYLTPQGVASSTYGTLDFQTPISELELDLVTKAEAESYGRWRDGYQRYWRQFFDPIAVRFSVQPGRLAADMTVMPLIEQTDYREMIQLTTGAELKPEAGDRHPGTLAHWAMAINPDAAPLREGATFVGGMIRRPNPLAWLGGSIAAYADADPFWKEGAAAEKPDEFFRQNWSRLPVAFHAEVKDSLLLAGFLAAVRGWIEQAAPDLTSWETLRHNELPYVKVTPTQQGRENAGGIPEELALYYAAMPRSLTVTLNEGVIKRALDREAARRARAKAEKAGEQPPADPASKLAPWLGTSLGVQADAGAIGLVERSMGDNYREQMQARCWGNLPILNEWRRLYPDRDPVALHEEHWQTTLRCPGDGKYVWNEKYQTMESTAHGHPGEPKKGPGVPALLKTLTSVNFGLTFEHQGLRARAELQREE